MKKIKVSELPLFNSLKGLFTIGTDDQNRSVKVSLEFIETETKTAVNNANAATVAANTAASQANTAKAATLTVTKNCQTATQNAITAKNNADTATANANAATAAANTAAGKALAAKAQADTAADTANASASEALASKALADTAADTANAAATTALTAKTDIQAMLDRLVPTALSVVCPERLTLGNAQAVVKAILTPKTALRNVIFLSDDKAAEIDVLTGQLTPVRAGKTKLRIVPTCNVSLTKTVLIEVGEPTARLAAKNTLRLSSGGAFRMN